MLNWAFSHNDILLAANKNPLLLQPGVFVISWQQPHPGKPFYGSAGISRG
jgi:hypothetical protein